MLPSSDQVETSFFGQYFVNTMSILGYDGSFCWFSHSVWVSMFTCYFHQCRCGLVKCVQKSSPHFPANMKPWTDNVCADVLNLFKHYASHPFGFAVMRGISPFQYLVKVSVMFHHDVF